jgi:hypothetical protein
MTLALIFHRYFFDAASIVYQQTAFLSALEERTRITAWLLALIFAKRPNITVGSLNQQTGDGMYLATLGTLPGRVKRSGGQKLLLGLSRTVAATDTARKLEGLHRSTASTVSGYVASMLRDPQLARVEGAVLAHAGHQRIKAKEPHETEAVTILRSQLALNLSTLTLDVTRGSDIKHVYTYSMYKLLKLVLTDEKVREFVSPQMYEEGGE